MVKVTLQERSRLTFNRAGVVIQIINLENLELAKLMMKQAKKRLKT